MLPVDEDINLEDQPCSICLDEHTYDDNEILFCEKCNVAVHQACYGIPVIPEGPWYCDVCESGGDPNTTPCCLCPMLGGAYRRTEDPKNWAHSLCMSWIPDAFVEEGPHKVPIYNCSVVSKSRFKLKCAVCAKPGACIQCAYGRCCTGAHPSCAVKVSKAFTHRIVKSLDIPGAFDWEIFCPAHADAVRDPVKPKLKVKRLHELTKPEGEDNHSEVEVADEDLPIKKGKKSKDHQNGKSSHAHPSVSGKSNARTGRKPDYALLNGGDDEDDDDFVLNKKRGSTTGRNNVGSGRNRLSGAGNASAVGLSNGNAKGGTYDADGTSVLNLSDWPGQTEGEPLDLQHFWGVVSMLYPEDRAAEVTEKMVKPLLDMASEKFSDELSLKVGDKSVTIQRLAAGDEDLVTGAVGTEKERMNAVDEWKLSQFLSGVATSIGSLRVANGTQDNSDPSSRFNHDDEEEIDDSHTNKDDVSTVFDLTPLEYFVMHGTHPTSKLLSDLELKLPRPCCNFQKRLCVVYDPVKTSSRVVCVYGVCLAGCGSAGSDNTREVLPEFSGDGSTRKYFVSPETSWSDSDACIFSNAPSQGAEKNGSTPLPLASRCGFRLLACTEVAESDRIQMDEKAIISKDDEDEVFTMLRRDIKAYRIFVDAIGTNVKALLDSDEMQSSRGSILKIRQGTEKVEARYVKHRIWKRIAISMEKGVRDQRPGFNRPVLDAIPASWTIKVGDRVNLINAAQNDSEDEDQGHEDTVCMVCFDGSSSEGNRIIFCDGCNAPAHQLCYGIVEIPEGDYYCDRCRAIQCMAEEYDDLSELCEIKDIYKCALCPLYHGGMKATTDGRWVHLCCAIWCGAPATLVGMEEMAAVDISKVPLLVPPPLPGRRQISSRGSFSDLDNTELISSIKLNAHQPALSLPQSEQPKPQPEMCAICGLSMGFLRSCSHGSGCSKIFHPICAWFAGNFIQCVVSDRSFMAVDRDDREYPSGLELNFYCAEHVPLLQPDELVYRSEQARIRAQYRISQDDLDYVPGTKRRKGAKKKKKAALTESAVVPARVSKDLQVDVYDKAICAICLQPTRPLFSIDDSGAKSDAADSDVVACGKCGIIVHSTCATNAIVVAGSLYPALYATAPKPISKPSTSQPYVPPHLLPFLPSQSAVKFEPLQAFDSGLAILSSVANTELNAMLLPVTDDNSYVVPQEPLHSSGNGSVVKEEWVNLQALVDKDSQEVMTTIENTSNNNTDEGPPAETVFPTDIPSDFAMEISDASLPNASTEMRTVGESSGMGPIDMNSSTDMEVSAPTDEVVPMVESNESKPVSPPPSAECDDASHVATAEDMEICSVEAVSVPVVQLSKDISDTPSSVKDEHQNYDAPRVTELPFVPWCCDMCLCQNSGDVVEGDDVRCQLCPRRGGVLYRTQYGKFIHGYCATHLCTVIADTSPRLQNPHPRLVMIKNVPGSKKQNCTICNRKTGVTIPCSVPECGVMFHPICAERTGTHYLRVRSGVREAFCPAHIPEQIYRLNNASTANLTYWVNGAEIKQLRISLDRARVLMDMVVRRERIRRSMIRADSELFEKKFRSICRRLDAKIQSINTAATAESIPLAPPPADLSETPEDQEKQPVVEPPTKPAPIVITAPMREFLAPFGHKVSATADDDDRMVDDAADFDVYNENIVLSPSLMKPKQGSLLAQAAESKRGRKSRKSGDFENADISFPASMVSEAVYLADEDTAYSKRKRGRLYGHAINSDHFEDPPSSLSQTLIKPHVAYGTNKKATIERFPRVLDDVKQFEVTMGDDSVKTVDVSSAWLTRASRRISDDDVLYYSSSDPKYMINVPLLRRMTLQLFGRNINAADVSDDVEDYSMQLREDLESALAATRAMTGIFADQDAANEFEHELGPYMDHCLNMTNAALQKEFNRNGIIKFKNSQNNEKDSGLAVTPATILSAPADAATKDKKVVAVPPEKVVQKLRVQNVPLVKEEPKPSKQMKIEEVFVGKSSTKSSAKRSTPQKDQKREADEVVQPTSKKTKVSAEPAPLSSPSWSSRAAAYAAEAAEVSLSMKALFLSQSGKGNQESGFAGVISEFCRRIDSNRAPEADKLLLASEFQDIYPRTVPQLLEIERKCGYVLQRLEEFTVPAGIEIDAKWSSPDKYLRQVLPPLVSNNSTSDVRPPPRKSFKVHSKTAGSVSSSTADGGGTRNPIEDFADFLYEDSEEVRIELGLRDKPVCISQLRGKLRSHQFHSIWEFASNFYGILNCYRRIAPSQSRIWWDSQLLAGLFERALLESNIPRNAANAIPSIMSDVEIVTNNSVADGETLLSCYWCNTNYHSSSLPGGVTSGVPGCVSFLSVCSDRKRISKGSSDKIPAEKCAWLCRNCVGSRGAELVNTSIHVWWPLDKKYYTGIIDAMDEFSLVHRVAYLDGEWEFVDLRNDMCLVEIVSQSPDVVPHRPGLLGTARSTSMTNVGSSMSSSAPRTTRSARFDGK